MIKAAAHGVSRALIAKAQGQKMSSAFWSGFASSAFSVGNKGYGDVTGRTLIMATIGGTVSQLTGGKFANGAVTGAFVHLFNGEIKTWIAKQGYKKMSAKITEKIAESLGVNKSMTNILKVGGAGLVGGVIGAIALAPLLPFAASVYAVAIFGGTIGLTGGLIDGAIMESSGINQIVEDIQYDAVIYVDKVVNDKGD